MAVLRQRIARKGNQNHGDCRAQNRPVYAHAQGPDEVGIVQGLFIGIRVEIHRPQPHKMGVGRGACAEAHRQNMNERKHAQE
ncbi:hypothetical protein D3C81_2080180 [compost metagenome]